MPPEITSSVVALARGQASVGAGVVIGGPHLILSGLLIAGPCCALLTARWALTAAAGGFAVVLGVVLGVPDQIFATVTQYAFLAAVATVGTTATWRGPHGFRLTCTPTGPGEGAP